MGGTEVRVIGTRDAISDDDFAALYRARLGHLVGFFRTKGIGTDEAADLAHETVLRTLLHLRRHGRTQEDIGPLTRTIARNLLVERLRRRGPITVALSDDVDAADDAPGPSELALQTERREAVRAAVSSLTPRHRKVIDLWLQGLSGDEIGQELGIKRNAVDALLHRARRSLANRLEPSATLGAIALVFLRSRGAVRRVSRSFASWAPSSVSIAPAGVSVATICLCAAVTLLSPQEAPAASDTHPVAAARAAVVAATQDVDPTSTAVATLDGAVPAPSVRRSTGTYSAGASTTISNPTTGKPDEIGVEVAYDPEQNSRGVIDDVVEPALESACGSVQTCTGGP